MPLSRPTLAELIERAAADIEAQLPGADARLRRSFLNVLARMHGGAMHSLYGYLGWASQQLFVDTAESAMLDRFASQYDKPRLPASFAVGPVTFAGTNGVVVPAGTELQRGDGAQFITNSDALIGAGVATVDVTALAAGAEGNTSVGTVLSLVQPVDGVSSASTVASGGIAQGADEEGDDALRARILSRIRLPPMGGSAADYEAWALEVPGVTRAWVYPIEGGPGTVVVRFVRDNDVSFIPDAGEVTSVQAYIDARRPLTAQLTVAAPTAAPLDMSITITPNTVAVKDAVTAELQDLLLREGRPGGTILLSHLREAVSVAAGETNHVITVPSADVTHASGLIPTLGTITWS